MTSRVGCSVRIAMVWRGCGVQRTTCAPGRATRGLGGAQLCDAKFNRLYANTCYINYILSYCVARRIDYNQSSSTDKALEPTVSAACFALMRLLRWAPSSSRVPSPGPGRPRCAPRSLPAPRPAASTASLTFPTPHTVPHSRLAPEGCALGERSFQHKRMVLAGRRGSGLPLSPRGRAVSTRVPA